MARSETNGEVAYPCSSHSGIVAGMEALHNGQEETKEAIEKVWTSVEKLASRWPTAATVCVTVLSGALGFVLGCFTMYAELIHKIST